jgi:aspartyl-tRNA(Asn)/glutamyl-tRNA(Gln) amidotransferase subunit A
MTMLQKSPARSAAQDALPLTISDAAAALRDGSLTSAGLLRAVQARADALDGTLGVYLHRLDDNALAAAEKADEELAAGIDKGPLHGIPIGIKDIISTADAPTTAQSLIMRPEFGAQGDAVVVARLRAAGAVITGKTTTMEYATGDPDPSKGFPTPHNAFDLSRWPGGSSSGTGSGVAAGMFLGGLGTDTGGSVRLPAAWSGISGMKPTFGRVPKSGCAPLGFSYDNIGPMTRSARDAAAMLTVLAGHDESDASSVDAPVDDYAAGLTGDVEGLRIGVDFSFLDHPGCDPDIAELARAAAAVFADAGAAVSPVVLPYYAEVCTASRASKGEALAYHWRDLQRRWLDYGRGTRASLVIGAWSTAADYAQAQRVRRVAIRANAELFASYDLVLTPTTLIPAPPLDGFGLLKILGLLVTPYWNGVGYPAMSIPMGLTSAGLPAGLQLAGRPFEEGLVFRAADAFQARTDHHLLESALVKEMLA